MDSHSGVVRQIKLVDVDPEQPELFSINQDYSTVTSIDYWRKICPELSINDKQKWENVPHFSFSEEKMGQTREQYRKDGFFTLDQGNLPWAVDVAAVANGIKKLVEYGWHPNFLLLYDEPWVMADQLSDVLLEITGNIMNFDWLAYFIEAPDGAGIPPHRDFVHCPPHSWHEDGRGKVTTVWMSLQKADPTNSCLYLLPASKDPAYNKEDTKETAHSVFPNGSSFQDIMAVPLSQGELVGFSHRVYHWGSSSSEYATEPRISIAFGASDSTFKASYCDRNLLPVPPFRVRLALMSAQMLIYNKRDCGPWPLTTMELHDYQLLCVLLRCFQEELLVFDEVFAKTVFDSPIIKTLEKHIRLQQQKLQQQKPAGMMMMLEI